MIFYEGPPFDAKLKDFPMLDEVVTVSNCYYYLSLLERFVSVIENMNKDELMQYLVRAESRYFRWIFSPVFKMSTKRHPPPLDVAFFWQAHMLSPLRYYEDMAKHFGPGLGDGYIPLKDIHDGRYEPTPKALAQWSQVMGKTEPYDFEGNLTELVYGDTTTSCIVCTNPAKITWKDYTEWRTNEHVAIRCYCCDAEYTIKHCGKANLLRDISYDFKISGLLLHDKRNFNPKKSAQKSKYFMSSFNLGRLPFDSGTDRIEKFLSANQDCLNPSQSDAKKKQEREELMAAIKTTYFCTPYRGSIDMLMAVTRQLEFSIKVTSQVDWKLPTGIVHGIRGYHEFLHLIQCSPGLIGVPNIAVDLAWHTHMCHPKNYRSFTLKHLKIILNHDDNIAPEDISLYIEKFEMARRYYHKEEIGNKGLATKNKKSIFQIAFKTPAQAASSIFGSEYWNGTLIIENNMLDQSLGDVSYHDRRAVSRFVCFNNSEPAQERLFELAQVSNLGFIGTSTCGAPVEKSLRPIEQIPGFPTIEQPFFAVIETYGIFPKLADHIKQKLPAYILTKYNNSQPYNYDRNDDPPPAYGVDEDALPSYYESHPIRKFDWSKLALIFSTVKDPQSEYINTVFSKDALPGFGRATEIYAMFLGTDTKPTIFGNVEASQIFPVATVTNTIITSVRDNARNNRENYTLNQFDQSMMNLPTQ